MPVRKLGKTVISSAARNLILLIVLTFKISPFSRNDKKWTFRTDTNYFESLVDHTNAPINRGKLYDVEVVNACLKLFKENGFKFK